MTEYNAYWYVSSDTNTVAHQSLVYVLLSTELISFTWTPSLGKLH